MIVETLKRVANSMMIIGTVIVMVFGFIQIVVEVSRRSQSLFLTVCIAILILVVLLIPFGYHLLGSNVLREFGVSKMRTRRICIEYKKEVLIDENFRAKVKVTQRWVFLEEPKSEDLIDAYEIPPSDSLENFRYESPDAIEVGRKQKGKNRVAIFWRPKKHIYPFIQYKHSDEYIPPVSYNFPASFSEYLCGWNTGHFVTHIYSPVKIENAILFRRPRFRRLKNDLKFIKYVLGRREFKWGNVKIINNGKEIKWEMFNPPMGNSYVCVFFQEGGVEYWKNKLYEDRLLLRLRRKLKRKVKPTTQSNHSFNASGNSMDVIR